MTALLLALLAAATLALLLRLRAGFRPAPTWLGGATAGQSLLDLTSLDRSALGSHATLVQVSAQACSTCPQVARALSEVAAAEPRVRHVELRAEDHLDLLERYDVRRSPTVLVLDSAGRVTARAAGPITADQARASLATLLTAEDPR